MDSDPLASDTREQPCGQFSGAVEVRILVRGQIPFNASMSRIGGGRAGVPDLLDFPSRDSTATVNGIHEICEGCCAIYCPAYEKPASGGDHVLSSIQPGISRRIRPM
jgi:hypothetical protein